ADKAGLKVGEEILSFNGETIANEKEFSAAVDKSEVEAWLRVRGSDGEVREPKLKLNKK
ncbi:MAG: hypothetical protein IKY61_08040, partial [Thermoguttaceae bacterium]|nr:hypothetical protein [Thermoguttaceae bacterium]